MIRRPTLLLAAIVTCASCAPQRAPTTAPPAPRPTLARPAPPRAAASTPALAAVSVVMGPGEVRTPAGAKLAVPPGFTARRQANVIELLGPDRAVRLSLLEVEGPDCAAAITRAWSLIDPVARWKLDQAVTPPSTEYDAVRVETYVARPDRRVAQAVARRKGKWIWVALLSGTPADLDKRAAQLRVFLGSLKAPGATKVDLSRKTPRSIVTSREPLVAFIQQALAATQTPGLAIAVVEQGKVVLAEGFGVRELGRTKPITPDTRMMIGSVTKSLTTLMMATMVDDGKLSWTARAVEVDPRFRLADEKLGAALKVEDLVCACAGLPRKDLPLIMAFRGKQGRDVFRELALMRPSTQLRETFQYQNHMVAAGGYVAAHAIDPGTPYARAYARAMQRRVFGPLRMTSTTLDHDAAVKSRDHATPHSQDLELRHHAVSFERERFAQYIAPSGAVWSTVRDMARYLIAELRGGVAPDSKRIVSEANLLYRRRPQVKVGAEASYALGWLVARTKELPLVSHGGGTMGFATLLSFLPSKGIGVVMISNGTGGHLVEGLVWARLMELWFGVDDKTQQQLQHAIAEQKKEVATLKPRLSVPQPDWIKPWLGPHHNDELGKIMLKAAGEGYLVEAGGFSTRVLRHDRPDGKKALIFAEPPLTGLELLVEDGALVMTRAQERYLFRRPAAPSKVL